MSEIIQDKIFGLSSGAREVMRCLFFHGPTEDGDIPSKMGRGELFRAGLAQHRHGFAWLTDEGVRIAIEVYQLDDQKGRWDRQRRATQ
jgi:hypothetical protein